MEFLWIYNGRTLPENFNALKRMVLVLQYICYLLFLKHCKTQTHTIFTIVQSSSPKSNQGKPWVSQGDLKERSKTAGRAGGSSRVQRESQESSCRAETEAHMEWLGKTTEKCVKSKR